MTMSKPPFEVSSQQPAGALEPGLLAQLLTTPAAAPAAPVSPASVDTLPVERGRGRARKAPPGSLGRGLAYLAAGALGAGLWALDAYYTCQSSAVGAHPTSAILHNRIVGNAAQLTCARSQIVGNAAQVRQPPLPAAMPASGRVHLPSGAPGRGSSSP